MKLYNINYQLIYTKYTISDSYLGIETAKYYSSYSDSQMSGMEIHKVVKSLARISKIK